MNLQGNTNWFNSRSKVKVRPKASTWKQLWAKWTGWKKKKEKNAREMDLTADKLKCNKTIVVRCVTVKATEGLWKSLMNNSAKSIQCKV